MVPFAFFKLMESTQLNYLQNIKKGIDWLASNNELHYNFLQRNETIFFRGIKRSSFLQKTQNICSLFFGNDSVLDKFISSHSNKIIKQEHSYHLGWILYAFNKKNRNIWCNL
jgi:hypothetical protein